MKDDSPNLKCLKRKLYVLMCSNRSWRDCSILTLCSARISKWITAQMQVKQLSNCSSTQTKRTSNNPLLISFKLPVYTAFTKRNSIFLTLHYFSERDNRRNDKHNHAFGILLLNQRYAINLFSAHWIVSEKYLILASIRFHCPLFGLQFTLVIIIVRVEYGWSVHALGECNRKVTFTSWTCGQFAKK